ncbi:MAG: HypC/HybG/HupF family hydrogenase formation chaperone [Lachnospiraceae bacterium]|nr:HypC/HybG/HupF family hydrogenase formation chaperone [Lachnospiraceae bacterium]MBQ7506279.1 HypC/HybG/HupF family hydrogenase formation chaperone [Lachnospiraceae bacterium]
MCVAYPGRIVSLPDEKSALVDFGGNRVNARRGFVEAGVGDYVLVHAGCILQKVEEKDLALFDEVK